MNVVRLIPVILSYLLIAAHFLRMGNLLVVAAAPGMVVLLTVERWWAARIVQIGLLAATAEWLRTLLILVAERQSAGVPWTRLAIILGAVAAFTLASTLVFFLPALRRRYGLGTPPASEDAPTEEPATTDTEADKT